MHSFFFPLVYNKQITYILQVTLVIYLHLCQQTKITHNRTIRPDLVGRGGGTGAGAGGRSGGEGDNFLYNSIVRRCVPNGPFSSALPSI